jgi:hypothetical protein
LPQSQPVAVQLQSAFATVHVMPTVPQLDISAGSDVGQSAAAQQIHVFESGAQSHISEP